MLKKIGWLLGGVSILASTVAFASGYEMRFRVEGMKVLAPEPAPEEILADAGADGFSCKDIAQRSAGAESGTYKILIKDNIYNAWCSMPEGYTLVANINKNNRNHISEGGYGSVAAIGSGTSGKLPDDVINALFTEELNLRCVGASRIIPKSSSCDVWSASAPTIDSNGDLHCANSFLVAHSSGHLGVAHANSSTDRLVYGTPGQNGCFNGRWGLGGELYVK